MLDEVPTCAQTLARQFRVTQLPALQVQVNTGRPSCGLDVVNHIVLDRLVAGAHAYECGDLTEDCLKF